jgi:hypothetical protein
LTFIEVNIRHFAAVATVPAEGGTDRVAEFLLLGCVIRRVLAEHAARGGGSEERLQGLQAEEVLCLKEPRQASVGAALFNPMPVALMHTCIPGNLVLAEVVCLTECAKALADGPSRIQKEVLGQRLVRRLMHACILSLRK